MKRKSIFSILVMVTILTLSVFSNQAYAAENFTDDDIVYRIINKRKVEIVGYQGALEELDFSAYVNGYSVVGIADNAFKGCTSLLTVNIPYGVEEIGSSAFEGCSALQDVYIPGSVEKIEKWAFKNCSALTSIDLSYGVETIEEGVFQGCTSLESIYFPGSVEAIKRNLFKNSTALKEVDISYGIEVIEESAFEGCTSLTSLYVPGSVKTVSKRAFYGCSSIEELDLSYGIKKIKESAFENCTSLTSLYIPGSVENIEKRAFYGCSSLSQIEIAYGVKKIGEYVFADCSALFTVDIGGRSTEISSSAFNNTPYSRGEEAPQVTTPSPDTNTSSVVTTNTAIPIVPTATPEPTATPSPTATPEPAGPSFEYVVAVKCIENMIFSTYNVDIYLDDEKLGEVRHGKEAEFSLSLTEGEHTLLFCEHNNQKVCGTITINITKAEKRTYTIRCTSDEVSIEKEEKEIIITQAQKELEKSLEKVFPREKAERAAVVAMTNCRATDVFKKDGNSYDTSKFHSYSDYSGFFLSVKESGTWWAVDENTWHVEGMKFVMSGTGSYMRADLDVTYTGKEYQVTSADTAIGLLGELDDIDSEFVNYEHFEYSEKTPYLKVTPKLIEKDRDEDALNDWLHRTSSTFERTDWIEDQFSMWNGKHKALEELIKENLNDERSYDHIETTYIDITTSEKLANVNQALKQLGVSQRAEMGDLFVITEFSAKNAFNARIKAKAYGLVSYTNGTVTLLNIE